MSKLRQRLRAFCADRRGTTAIEFSLVAIPFLMLIFGITGISLYYFTEVIFDKSMNAATRQIRTGQSRATAAGELSVGKLKQEICEGSRGLIDCNHLSVILNNEDSWDEFESTASCVDDEGSVVPSNYADHENVAAGTGGRNRVVVVVACYPWKLLATIPFLGLGDVNDGEAKLMRSVVAFKSEPY